MCSAGVKKDALPRIARHNFRTRLVPMASSESSHLSPACGFFGSVEPGHPDFCLAPRLLLNFHNFCNLGPQGTPSEGCGINFVLALNVMEMTMNANETSLHM